MISISNLYIQYGDRVLFDNISLTIGAGEKLGLVGRNGAGKSTLMKIIAGAVRPDEGAVSRPSEATIGYLHQDMKLPQARSVMEETLTAFEEIKAMERRLAQLNEEIAQREDYDSPGYLRLIDEFTALNDRFHLMGGVAAEAEAEKVLKGLGFQPKDFQRPTSQFSGGWQMRVELAKMLLRRPDYLLLDEPTNHLDIESILWLETFLSDYPGAVVLISHDREFLDNVAKRTVEIELGNIYDYKASYSKYVEMRKERREKQRAAYENQQRVIAQRERTINRFMAKASKTRMAQSMQKQLDKMERVEIDEEDSAVMNIRFPPAPRSGQIVLEARKLSKRYGELSVLEKVEFKLDRGERVAFVGQNGQGKTTLAKILVKAISPSAGEVTLGHNVSIGYYAQDQSDALAPNLTLLETMESHSPPEMRARLRAILGAFMFSGEDVEKKVSVLSGGERARLALACLLLRPFNLLVLDEPTNHLDMLSKDVLKRAVMAYDGALIVVSHDREFLAGLTHRVIEFRQRQLFEYLGDVNFFLEKRRLDDMRQVEMSTASSGNGQAKPKRELSFEERKRLQRNAQKVEKKIERLESDIAALEAQMAQSGFYESTDSEKIMRRYHEARSALDIAMHEWEEAQIALEE
jgi:ATP-binding cassette subfamily F protein 3